MGKSFKESRNIEGKAATMDPAPERPSVGQLAPRFSLTSLSGAEVDLASYRGRSNVLIWFSRGFTCPFCRIYIRVKSKATREIAGTGLGLAIARTVVEAFDGRIRVDSVEGSGTTFTVELPIARS